MKPKGVKRKGGRVRKDAAREELMAIHHALLNPMDVVYDPAETWTVRNAKLWIIAARKSGTFVYSQE